MAFDYSTLITDRAQTDIDALKAIVKKPMSQWTAEEAEAFKAATLKGSYDYTDLNRVSACMEDLVARLNWLGCNVPGYERVEIDRASTPTSRLPAGYTEVAYIQSSGTQYVDTGFQPNQDSGIEVKFKLLELGVNSYIAGTRYSATSQNYSIMSNTDNYYRQGYNNAMYTSGSSDTEQHTIRTDKNLFYLDGELTSTATYATFTGYGNVFLCAISAPSGLSGKIQIFSAKIYDNGTLVRDYVPCINASSTVGLYDLVNGRFYGNAGTGTFTAAVVK